MFVFNAAAGLAAAIVWLAFIYTEWRGRRRWVRLLLLAASMLSALYFGMVYAFALFNPESIVSFRSLFRPVIATALGAPAMLAFLLMQDQRRAAAKILGGVE